jgi:hypothetical protein
MAKELKIEMVKVKILPLHNIGGIGQAGDVVWMVAQEAAIYVKDGYVEIIDDDAPPASQPAPTPLQRRHRGRGRNDQPGFSQ